MAGGATLGEIITANGGDLEAVKTALVEAYSELPNRSSKRMGARFRPRASQAKV
jgi:hypothetical protein